MRHLKNILLIILGILCLNGCGVSKPRYIDVERIVTTYKDSTVLNVRDSIVWTPKEYYKDYTSLLDTLSIKGSNTEAKAWVDTTNHILAGTLLKEPEIAKEWHIQYVDRIVERTDTLVRTETIEIPVEKKVPYRDKWFWGLVSYLIVSLLGLALFIKHKLLL